MFEQAVACRRPYGVGWSAWHLRRSAGGQLRLDGPAVAAAALPKAHTPTLIVGPHAEIANTPVPQFVPREQGV